MSWIKHTIKGLGDMAASDSQSTRDSYSNYQTELADQNTCSRITSVGKRMEPVQIVERVGVQFKFHLDAFKNIINNNCLKDYPLPIYSINGNTRSGKSFLMNYFFEQDTAARGNIGNEVHGGFTSKKGPTGVTQGIMMWPKPIYILNKNNTKVAVLLMDTQGLFDEELDPRANEVLFWISCMLSSTFIYNVKGEFSFDRLEFLDSFIASANMYANDGRYCVPMPKLVIAMRDWHWEESFTLGMHKLTHQNKSIKTMCPKENNFVQYRFFGGKSVSNQNKKIVGSILDNFSTIEACLLPNPGTIFLKNGTNLDPEFNSVAKAFARDQLNPSNIFVKGINNGNSITGADLIYIGSFINNILKANEMTETLTMKDLQKAYRFQQLCEKVSDELNKHLFFISSESKDILTLDRIYKMFRDKNLGELDKIGDSEERNKQQEMLAVHMDKIFDHHLQRLIDLLKSAALTNYNCELLMVSYFDEIEDEFDRYSQKHLSDFDEKTECIKDHYLIDQNRDEFKSDLLRHFKEHSVLKLMSLKSINLYASKIHMENVRVLEMEFLLKKNDKYTAYIDENNLPELDIANYQKQHKKLANNDCITEFAKDVKNLAEETLFEQYCIKLESCFNEKYNLITSLLVSLYNAIHKYNRGLLNLDLLVLSIDKFEISVDNLKAKCIESTKRSCEHIQINAYDCYKETLENIINRFYDCHLERLVELLGNNLIEKCNKYMFSIDISAYHQHGIIDFESELKNTFIGKTKSFMNSEIVQRCVSRLEHNLNTCFKEHKDIQAIIGSASHLFDENIFQMTIARLNDVCPTSIQKEPVELCAKLFREKSAALQNRTLVEQYYTKLGIYTSMRNSEALTNLLRLQNVKDEYNRSMSSTNNTQLNSTLMKEQHDSFKTKCTTIFQNISRPVHDKAIVVQYNELFDNRLVGMESNHLKVFVNALTESTTAELKKEAFSTNIFDVSSDEFAGKLKDTENKILKNFIDKTAGIEDCEQLTMNVKKKLKSCVEENQLLYDGCQKVVSSYVTKLAEDNASAAKAETSPERLRSNAIYKEYIEALPAKVLKIKNKVIEECKSALPVKPESDKEIFNFYQSQVNNYLTRQGQDVEKMTGKQKDLLEKYYNEIIKMKEVEIKRAVFVQNHERLKKKYKEEFSQLSNEIRSKKLYKAQSQHFENSMNFFFNTHNKKRDWKNGQNSIFRRVIRWFQGF